MICKHNRIQKFIKKTSTENIVGYVYCCIDCKEIFETYGLEADKDLDKKVIATLDMMLSDNYYQFPEIVHSCVRDEAEITRRKLDGEPLRNQTEEEKH